MAECKAIISYLASFSAADSLYKDPVFAMGLLKLFSNDVRRLIFTLLTSSVHVSRLKNIPNIKESLSTIVQIRLASKVDDKVVLCGEFREVLLRGFCLPGVDFSIIQQHSSKVQSAEAVSGFLQNLTASGSPLPAHNVLSAPMSNSCESGDLVSNGPHPASTDTFGEAMEKLSSIKFQNLLQAIVTHDSKLMYGVKDILVFCSLTDLMYQITSKGFEFLLRNRVDQHWIIILSSIKYFAHGLDEERQMLGYLMELCIKDKPGLFCVQGWSNWYSFLNSIGVLHVIRCSTEFNGRGLATLRQSMEEIPVGPALIENIASLEVEMEQLDPAFSYFYLNNTCLFDTVRSLEINSHKFIFLETNFKIYAYTDKVYEKSILSLFSRTVYTLPNLIKAQLDEESVTSAYTRGITAEQLLKYLGEFAHNVPHSIANQIVIWASKQHRLTSNSAVLYADFLHLSDYLQVLRFLERKNAVLLKDEEKRIIVGTEETYVQIKDLLRDL